MARVAFAYGLSRAATAVAAGLATLVVLAAGPSPAWAQTADLGISKSAPVSAASNTDITYTLFAFNVGPDDASSASVTDPLPGTLTFVSVSAPAPWSCTTPAVGTNGTVICTNATFPSGASATITVVAHIPPGTAAGTAFTDTATISSATFDPNAENNTASTSTTVSGAPSADLAMNKSAPAVAFANQNISYTLMAINVGPDAATSVVVTDPLPGTLTFVSVSAPAGWACTSPAVGTNGTVTCTTASLAAGVTAAITLTAHVPAGTADGTTFTDTATISSATADPNPENNSSTITTTVVSGPDLTIAKTHSGNAQRGQTGFTYTITVSNVGSSPSVGVVSVSDTVPGGLTATAISGSGWACAVGATSTCSRADALAAGASYPTITLVVSVAANAPSTVTNTATVSGGGDVNGANNTASDPTMVGATAQSFTFTILQGTSKTVDLTSGATGGPFTGATIVSINPPGGTATITQSGASFLLTFTPPATFTGTVVVTFTLKTTGSTTPPATVTFIVVPRRDPSQDPDVIGLINAQIAAAERFANAQMMNLNQRLESLHEDGYGQDRQGITAGSSEQPPYAYAADPFGNPPGSSANADKNRSPSAAMFDRMITKVEPKSPEPVGPAGSRRDFSFWSSGYVNFGSNDSLTGSAFDFTTSGVTVGADYRFNPFLTAGIGVGYGRDRSTIGIDGTLSLAQTYSVSLYETYRPIKGVFVDGILGFGTLRFDSQRFIIDDGDFAFGSRSGNEWFGSLTAGYEYRNGRLLLSPYGRVKAVWLTLDAFSEFGDPTGSLTFAPQSVDTVTGVLGLRGKYDILMDWGVVSPRFRVEYNHGFQNGGIAALGFADFIGGPTFFVPTQATTSDFATIGIGTDVKLPNDMFVNFDYQTTINAFDTHSHMFQMRAGVRF